MGPTLGLDAGAETVVLLLCGLLALPSAQRLLVLEGKLGRAPSPLLLGTASSSPGRAPPGAAVLSKRQ